MAKPNIKIKGRLRLDKAVVNAGLAADVLRAQSKIMAGRILVDGQLVDKAGTLVAVDAVLRDRSQPFVSRGGQKLFGFVTQAKLQSLFVDALVLDIGSSTGGFTDCALRLGASAVTCLDVGKNLLHWSLRQDVRIRLVEGTHVRDFEPLPGEVFTLILADISFNSLQRLMPEIDRLNPHRKARILLLIKPQFELEKSEIPEGGIVTETALQQAALMRVRQKAESFGYQILMSEASPLRGTKGNQEYFMLMG